LSIVTEYPFGFIFFCLLLGVAYAFFLYFRTRDRVASAWQFWTMSALRFISVFLIAFLLLSPLIKKRHEIIDKPVIIFAQDNSLSVAFSKDSVFYRTAYPKSVKEFQDKLAANYEVPLFSFGDKVTQGFSSTYSEKVTDIAALIDEVSTRYSNRNIGALIIASDGIYNRGSNPYYPAQKLRFPIYTVGLGDSTLHRDLIIKKITYNHSVFLGDKFPVEIDVEANHCSGEKSELELKKGNQVLATQTLQFSNDKVFRKINLLLEAKEKGIQRYTATLKQVGKEATEKNNTRDFYVDVFDTRQKILLLYSAPHPDIAAIRHALEGVAKYEVSESQLDDFTQIPEMFDLIILYQLPSGVSNLKKLVDSKVPLLFVLGTQTRLNDFNALKSGLTIISDHANYSESLPGFNESFSLFTVDQEIREMLKNSPPLISPFGQYQFPSVSDVMLFQRMGTVQSHMPLLFFVQNAAKRSGFLTGENIWKWRLTDYLQNGNQKAFDDLMNKIVQYLSVKGDQNFFRVKCENSFQENENIEMEAELLNASYELINQDDINLVITDEKSKSYPFIFSRSEKGYFLNAGNFPPGKYQFSASVKTGKNFYQRKGEFVVTPLNLEELSTTADFNLLYRMAVTHDGELVSPHDLAELAKKISHREDIKPVSYFQKRYSEITGNIWVFVLILGLLSLEWFMRKRGGIY
jgi:hypothetical protein